LFADPLGELTALPRPPSCMKRGEKQVIESEKRGKGKEPREAKRKRRIKEKEWNLRRN